MGRLKRVLVALILSSCWWASAPGRAAHAQACGCSQTFVIVGDEEGEAVRGVTVELLRDGLTVQNCGDGSPARQSGKGRKFKFKFKSYEHGPPEVLLRVTAPGYNTYEETGAFMSGCWTRVVEVVLRKAQPSYRAR